MVVERDNLFDNILDGVTLYEVYEVINFFSKHSSEDLIKLIKNMKNINIKGIIKDIDLDSKIKIIYIKDINHKKGLKINIPKTLMDKAKKISPDDQIKCKIKIKIKEDKMEFVLLELRKIRV